MRTPLSTTICDLLLAVDQTIQSPTEVAQVARSLCKMVYEPFLEQGR